MVGTGGEVVDGLGIERAVEAVEGAGDLDEPGILDGVVEPVEEAGEVLDAGLAGHVGSDQLGGHPRGVGQLGIVVVAEDLVEVAGRGSVRVDVRVGVEDRPAGDLVEQLAGEGILRRGGWGGGGRHGLGSTRSRVGFPIRQTSGAGRMGQGCKGAAGR